MSSVATLYMKLHKGTPSGEQIKGESVHKDFEGEIEIEDWSWALSRQSRSKSSVDTKSTVFGREVRLPEPNKAEPSAFCFSKHMDRATTAMLSAAKTGEALHAVVTLEEASDAQFELVITMEKVRVTSYEMNVQNEKSSGTVEESWEFEYQKIYFDYKPSAKAGTIRLMLDRSPGAKTDSPANKTKISALIAAAEKLNEGELKTAWDGILDSAKKRASSSAAASGG